MRIGPGHRALVTGAASGLGLAITHALSARGCRVLGTDLAETAPVLDGRAGVTYARLDVRSDADWAAAHDWVETQWHGLDLLVNNAGVGSGGDIDVATLEEWQRVLDVNLLGVVRGCRTFAPMLRRQRAGQVVNIASAAGLAHPAGMATYSAAKAGVVALSETLRYELGRDGVDVSVVCPTFLKTAIAEHMPDDGSGARERAQALIDASPRTADQVAARILRAVDAGRFLVLPDPDVVAAYTTKRLLRPVYDWQLRRLARRHG